MFKFYCYTLYVISMQKVNKKRVKLSLHSIVFSDPILSFRHICAVSPSVIVILPSSATSSNGLTSAIVERST